MTTTPFWRSGVYGGFRPWLCPFGISHVLRSFPLFLQLCFFVFQLDVGCFSEAHQHGPKSLEWPFGNLTRPATWAKLWAGFRYLECWAAFVRVLGSKVDSGFFVCASLGAAHASALPEISFWSFYAVDHKLRRCGKIALRQRNSGKIIWETNIFAKLRRKDAPVRACNF